MTTQNESIKDRQVDPKDEIEVTREMIEAGRERLAYFYYDLSGQEYEEEANLTVIEIYKAMRLAALASERDYP